MIIKIAKFINYSSLIFFIGAFFGMLDKCDAIPVSKLLIMMAVSAFFAYLSILFESRCYNKLKNKIDNDI